MYNLLTELNWNCTHQGAPVACEPDKIPANTVGVISADVSYGVL
jgi:hypothetical protein